MNREIYRLVVLVLLLLHPLINMQGQHSYPVNYFRSPVNFPITLSGSFAEIRRNHFHSGIDIRTAGVQGKPIYAVADGYVSRVNVSPSGFGKALYITHPNGYTSLYAHLHRYAGAIASWVKNRQYKTESFAIDVEVPVGALRVKKGDIIAYSGNSGSSGGPHLHFEIRDAQTQEIIDPLDFGFIQKDGISPRISSIKIYPFSENATVNNATSPLLIPVIGAHGQYALKTPDTIRLSGSIVFGIETSDNGEGGLNTGVHAIELTVDDVKVFSQDIERFAFAETRYVNSVIDYPAFIQRKRKIQRSYVAPNNKLSVFKEVKNRGVINFSDARTHKIRYMVRDALGNMSNLVFYVRSRPPANEGGGLTTQGIGPAQVFTYKADNQFERSNCRLYVPKEALYDDLPFEYTVTPPVNGSYAYVHHLQNKNSPLHTFCALSIKAESMPAHLEGKAVIVEVGANNRFSSRGGSFENGWVKTRIRDFGNYTVAVDTEPPVIRPVNIVPNKKVTKQSTIQVKVSDNLSGIKVYRGTLNGKWILMDYDEKNRLLVYSFDENIKTGKNHFVLMVADAAGNSTLYKATLIR